MSTVSAAKKQQIQQLRYSKIWALTNRKGGARICIDGTVSASVILDDVPNRGGLGIGALLNSSHKSGKTPNCMLLSIPRVAENFSMANYFYANEDEKEDIVAVTLRDIAPDEELLYYYNWDGATAVPGAVDAAEYDFQEFCDGVGDADLGNVVPPRSPHQSSASACVHYPRPANLGSPGYGYDSHIHIPPPPPQPPRTENPELLIEREQSESGGAPIESDLLQPQTNTTVPAMTVEEQSLMHHGDISKRITSAALKLFVRSIHLITPSIVEPTFKLVNISNAYSQDYLQRWCVDQASRMKYSRENRVKTQMSARESVEAVMRMLTIFATEQTVRDHYCQTRQIASQEVLDGQMLGINSVFWIDMHLKFHNLNDFRNEFPFEYMPTSYQQKNNVDSRIIDFVFPPPDKIVNGLLKGMDLKHGRKPSGFLDAFFSRAKLYQLWTDSLSFYRKTDANWSRSGVATSDPFYHYVMPITIFDIKRPLQTCGVTQPTKRWESVAWFVVMLSPPSPLQPKRADLSPQEAHYRELR
jgi:hypothetical protein